MKVVFVGINPGLMSAAAGHYYANPRNPFWRLLHEAGLTPVRLAPEEDARLLEFGYGITDIVKRPSRGVGDLARLEFYQGKKVLEKKLLRVRPLIVCFNSKSAFLGFSGKDAFRGFGRQRVRIGQARVYVLPSTSPANAAVPLAMKRRYFRGLKRWLDQLQIVRLPPRPGAHRPGSRPVGEHLRSTAAFHRSRQADPERAHRELPQPISRQMLKRVVVLDSPGRPADHRGVA